MSAYMSRPYTHRGYSGYVFQGNRMHPEDISWINAQLAADEISTSPFEAQPDTDVVAHMATRQRFKRESMHGFSILEKLQARPELLQKLAEVAVKNAIPDNWHLNRTPTDGAEELHREQRLGLLHSLGEAALEAPAA